MSKVISPLMRAYYIGFEAGFVVGAFVGALAVAATWLSFGALS